MCEVYNSPIYSQKVMDQFHSQNLYTALLESFHFVHVALLQQKCVYIKTNFCLKTINLCDKTHNQMANSN